MNPDTYSVDENANRIVIHCPRFSSSRAQLKFFLTTAQSYFWCIHCPWSGPQLSYLLQVHDSWQTCQIFTNIFFHFKAISDDSFSPLPFLFLSLFLPSFRLSSCSPAFLSRDVICLMLFCSSPPYESAPLTVISFACASPSSHLFQYEIG